MCVIIKAVTTSVKTSIVKGPGSKPLLNALSTFFLTVDKPKKRD
jgi:hypothetical protein